MCILADLGFASSRGSERSGKLQNKRADLSLAPLMSCH